MPKLLVSLLVAFSVLLNIETFAIDVPVIRINEKTVNQSLAKQILIAEDKDHTFTIEKILTDTTLQYSKAHNNVENLNFSTSGFWIRFKVVNELPKEINFLLETGRPVTNKVMLYQVSGKRVIRHWVSGDNVPFSQRVVGHRKCIFPVQLNDNNEREFVIYLESDGEVISVPLIFWLPQDFMEYDYYNQLFLGIFFGVLFFVAIIYFFFFIALREKSFLYYVLYVFFMAMLQFSLDGLAFQFFFPNSPYWADHFVLLSASGAVYFVLLFGNSFLKLKIHAPGYHKVFKILIPIIGVIVIFSLIPGPTFPLMYPIINLFSFISMILTLATIIHLKIKRKPVDWFFFFAFAFLIISAFVFILGNFNIMENRGLTEGVLKVGSGLEMIFLSLSLARKYRELLEAKEVAQRELLVQLEEKNKLAGEINIRLEQQVTERTREINHQRAELEEKNKEITSSITYARRIQFAILPPDEIVKEAIPDSFILYKPRDIVSGDFYFVYPVSTSSTPPSKLALFAAVDCTGHGVPGAFMSILGNNILKASLKEQAVNSPSEALDYLNKKIIETLSQSKNEVAVRDGMDISLCAYNTETLELYYAGANLPAWILTSRNGNYELVELSPDKHPIGDLDNKELYNTKNYQLQKGDMVYVFSDGYADQFGGPKGKKFRYSQMKELLLTNAHLPVEKQKEAMETAFMNWKGNTEQVDDVLVIGVRV